MSVTATSPETTMAMLRSPILLFRASTGRFVHWIHAPVHASWLMELIKKDLHALLAGTSQTHHATRSLTCVTEIECQSTHVGLPTDPLEWQTGTRVNGCRWLCGQRCHGGQHRGGARRPQHRCRHPWWSVSDRRPECRCLVHLTKLMKPTARQVTSIPMALMKRFRPKSRARMCIATASTK